MENYHLSTRLLDTAIKAMERNRALLFTINLIAALILVVVYLETASFDNKQRDGHLIVYQFRCNSLNEMLKSVPNVGLVSEEDKKSFRECSDLNKMRGFVTANSTDQAQLEAISTQIFRLHRIQNEMREVKLGVANVAPLIFGIQVPRNDIVIICGVLLVILYTWLAFSFDQLARITTKIKNLFPEAHRREEEDGDEGTEATISDLVEINFLFRTSKGGVMSLLVKAIYWLAPVAMTIATINDLNSATGGPPVLERYIWEISKYPIFTQLVITLLLWAIGYKVNRSDKRSNVTPVGAAAGAGGPPPPADKPE